PNLLLDQSRCGFLNGFVRHFTIAEEQFNRLPRILLCEFFPPDRFELRTGLSPLFDPFLRSFAIHRHTSILRARRRGRIARTTLLPRARMRKPRRNSPTVRASREKLPRTQRWTQGCRGTDSMRRTRLPFDPPGRGP